VAGAGAGEGGAAGDARAPSSASSASASPAPAAAAKGERGEVQTALAASLALPTHEAVALTERLREERAAGRPLP
jgi:hypothetical protein